MVDHPKQISPIPVDVLENMKGSLPRERGGNGREGIWIWRDQDGLVLKVTQRFPDPERGKVVLPFTLWETQPGQYAWKKADLPTPRPLYGLDRLAAMPGAPVLVVEGEKAADAAVVKFPDYTVVTSGGSTSATNADWSLLQGHPVVHWPDHDEPGMKYAREVGVAVRDIASGYAVVQVPDDFPEKWDLADDPPEGWDTTRLRGLLDSAVEVSGNSGGLNSVGIKNPAGQEPASHPSLSPPPQGAWIVGDVGRYLREDPPPVRWLVPGLIPAGVPGILAARAGAGKSMTALAVGMGLASGLGVLGKAVSTEEARGVLFVGLEDDEAEFHRRVRRGMALLEEDPDWTPAHRAALEKRLVPLFPNRASGSAFGLEDQWPSLAAKAAGIPGGCGLIILDTLSRMADGDENSASDMRPFNEAVSGLAQATGAAVLSIHHVGKGNDALSVKKLWERLDPEALRGSSAVEAAARFIIQLAALTPSEAEAAGLEADQAFRGGYVALHLSKISAAEKGSTVLLERRQGDEPGAGFLSLHHDSERILSVIRGAASVLKLTRRDSVLLAIAAAGGLQGLDQKAAAELIWPDAGNPKGQWDKALSALRKAGWLKDPHLTDFGWAQAETLGFAPSARKGSRIPNPPGSQETLGLPLGRGETEETEGNPSFHSEALGRRNGRKESSPTLEAEEMAI